MSHLQWIIFIIQDHLTCFLPGTLILAVENGLPEYMKSFGEELLKTCYLTYKWNPTFLAPEITHFNFEVSYSHYPYNDEFLKLYTNEVANISVWNTFLQPWQCTNRIIPCDFFNSRKLVVPLTFWLGFCSKNIMA